MDKDNIDKYTVTSKEDIDIGFDTDGVPYTNESLFEFLTNRNGNLNPISEAGLSLNRGGGGSGTLDVGTWAKGPVPLNIGKVSEIISQYINGHYITSKSMGKCAKYVRIFLEYGFGGGKIGEKALAGHPVAAKNYAKFLPSIGFKLVTQLNGRKAQADYTRNGARVGDVAVMNHSVYGHICIWNGRNWISDFIQHNMWPYTGDGLVYIFRYTE